MHGQTSFNHYEPSYFAVFLAKTSTSPPAREIGTKVARNVANISRHWREVARTTNRVSAKTLNVLFRSPPPQATFVQPKYQAKAHTRGGVPAKICIPARENLSRRSRNALQPMPPPRVSFFAPHPSCISYESGAGRGVI